MFFLINFLAAIGAMTLLVLFIGLVWLGFLVINAPRQNEPLNPEDYV